MPEYSYICIGGGNCAGALHHRFCALYNLRRRDEHSAWCEWWYNTGIAKHWRGVEAEENNK